uniref:Serpentine Receptor, class T n=1 Tax=Panagrellus redivivus TaxID=6233 RepID=A0A7E4WBH4_PANRE
MEFLLLRITKWVQEYHCDFYNASIYQENKYDHPYLSVLYVILGVTLLIMYIPCVYAMVSKKMLTESCYKIMFCLAVYDIVNLVLSGIVTGIFGLFKIGYCHSPRLFYLLGNLAEFSWFGQVMSAILLALNRCFFLRNVHFSNMLFGGHKTYIWMAVFPFAWSICGLTLCRPVISSLYSMVWLFNPHDGYRPDSRGIYVSPYHYANNIIAAVALPGIYVVFLVLYCLKTNQWAFKSANNMQLSVFLQSFFISLFTTLLATLYIVIQYVPLSKEWFYLAQIIWINYQQDRIDGCTVC